MTAFVEECRQEWKRLGVPDLMADEMATDLEADLAEAHADGVSAAEILGESDPRRFAAAWANERGLVSEPPPQEKKSRKRFWIGLAVGLVVLGFLLGIGGVALFATTKVTPSGPPPGRVVGIPPIKAVQVPLLVGLKACHAERIALAAELHVRHVPRRRCDAVVVRQTPAAGQAVEPHARLTLQLARP